MTTEILIGCIAVAKLGTLSCFPGEIGVCYGAAVFEGQPVYGFIFETGRFAVFTAEDVTRALNLTGRVSEAIAGYRYANDGQLRADFRTGRFAAAFPALKR